MVSPAFRTIKKRKRAPIQRPPSRLSMYPPPKSFFAVPTGELKFFDTTKATTTVGSAGTILDSSLCLIQQGNGESQRIGRKVVVRSLHIRGKVNLVNSSLNQSSDIVRIIVYLDKQSNGATVTPTLLLTSADYRSWRNLQQVSRFRFLHDKSYTLNAAGAAGNGTTDNSVEHFRSLMINLKVTTPLDFDASTGAITDLTSANIGIMGITDSGLAKIDYICRVRYSDR